MDNVCKNRMEKQACNGNNDDKA